MITTLIQALLLIAIAPLISGIIRKIKNTFRMRRGAGIFQPYYNFFKLLSKEQIVSETASWIFTVTPYIVLSSAVTALFLVPAVVSGRAPGFMGDFLAVIFLLALGRFFIALAALDAGSAFGGMGSSREMFISCFVEPVAVLAVFTVSFKAGTTNLNLVNLAPGLHLSSLLAAVSIMIVTIAETSRIPVDNRETHLELTMIHEAMVLEYSGRSLALIELAGHIKQILFFVLAANVLLPPAAIPVLSFSALSAGIAELGVKILGISLIIGIIEVSIAKMRLFRAVDLLAFGFVLSCMSIITAITGF